MATNADAPRGFELVAGVKYASLRYALVVDSDTTPLGVGDGIKVSTSEDGKFVVTRAGAGDTIIGVVQIPKVKPTPDGSSQRRESGDEDLCGYIPVDVGNNEQVFRMQTATGTSLDDTTHLGANRFFDIAIANADATTGISQAELDLSTVHASSGQCFLIGLDSSYNADNAEGQAHAKVLVKIVNT